MLPSHDFRSARHRTHGDTRVTKRSFRSHCFYDFVRLSFDYLRNPFFELMCLFFYYALRLLEGKALTNLLSGLAIGCSSKSADAKIAAKKALGLLKDHGFDLKALTAQAPHLSPTASSEILRAAPGATSGGASMKGSKRNNAAGRTAAREAAAMEAAEAREREAAERAAAAPDEEL